MNEYKEILRLEGDAECVPHWTILEEPREQVFVWGCYPTLLISNLLFGRAL